jgi:hypothetical protein
MWVANHAAATGVHAAAVTLLATAVPCKPGRCRRGEQGQTDADEAGGGSWAGQYHHADARYDGAGDVQHTT